MPDIPEPDEKDKKRKREDSVPVTKAQPSLKSRGTLLVCPMSTITNWEDQIREHWNGRVEVVGGATGQTLKPAEKKWKPPKSKRRGEDDDDSSDEEELDILKVYIYHGPSRCSDPEIIADFDIVMTSYNTLANEYSKSSASCEDTPVDTANNSDDEFVSAGDTSTNPRAVKPEVEAEIKANEVADALSRKRKKAGKGMATPAGRIPERSPLQSISWFRIVLDEAQYV
jgi:SNF2 family DNA or RNA helicase